jgi:hypothetical protein
MVKRRFFGQQQLWYVEVKGCIGFARKYYELKMTVKPQWVKDY